MPIWLYAGNPAPSTDQGPPWPQDRGRPRPGVVLGPEAPPTCLFRLIIWWSGQSAGNLLSKEGRAPQRLHARACGTDSVPPGPLGPRTGPEDQGPPVLGPVGGPRAGCGIVCSRRGWDLRWAALGRAQKRREGQLELYSLRPSPPVSTSTSYNSGFWALFGTF